MDNIEVLTIIQIFLYSNYDFQATYQVMDDYYDFESARKKCVVSL
jgi:hypothetical protein